VLLGQWRLVLWEMRGVVGPRATMEGMRPNPSWDHLGLDRRMHALLFDLSVDEKCLVSGRRRRLVIVDRTPTRSWLLGVGMGLNRCLNLWRLVLRLRAWTHVSSAQPAGLLAMMAVGMVDTAAAAGTTTAVAGPVMTLDMVEDSGTTMVMVPMSMTNTGARRPRAAVEITAVISGTPAVAGVLMDRREASSKGP
jgi:hypothetical protein